MTARPSAFAISALSVALVILYTHGAAAQLTEKCTVSVLNRNVRVKRDGSWVLPNVPANFGPVRARVTCVVDGKTVFGESEPFTVPPNGAVNVPKIRFGPSTPIPTAIAVSAPIATLTHVGDSLQLQAVARYADGSTREVSSSSAGTLYTISNPAIASVSADGVVTALKGGTVIVQAAD